MKNTLTINTNGKFEVECVDMVDSGSNSIILNVITGEKAESLHIYMNDTLLTTFSGLISGSENPFIIPDDCYVADSLLKIQYGSDSFLLFSFPSSTIGNMTVEKSSDLSYSVKYTTASNINNHLSDTSNPHKVTASQIGAMSEFEDESNPGCYYYKRDDIIEWENPPFAVGIEYRTTERYNGKVVYAKILDIGNLPNATTKTISTGVNGSKAVSIEPIIYMASGGITPYPFVDAKGASMVRIFLALNGSMYVTSFADISGASAKVKIKYVKG